jgi:hypothetical protein
MEVRNVAVNFDQNSVTFGRFKRFFIINDLVYPQEAFGIFTPKGHILMLPQGFSGGICGATIPSNANLEDLCRM